MSSRISLSGSDRPSAGSSSARTSSGTSRPSARADLAGDDLGDERPDALAGAAELEDVQPVVVGLDERRQRAALSQRGDVARRRDGPQAGRVLIAHPASVPRPRQTGRVETGGTLADVLAAIDDWGADHAAAALVGPAGVVASHGDVDHVFRWASVTKLLTASVVLLEVDAGTIDLDEPAGPPGATVRHLLAHASGLPFEGSGRSAPRPGRGSTRTRDTTSSAPSWLSGQGGPSQSSLADRLLRPLGMTRTELRERPSQGLWGPLADLSRFAHELLRPVVLPPDRLAEATTVQFPGLAGVLPGVGRFDPLDWGLGFDLRDAKSPHWTGASNSPGTFGHFGGAGTFLWVDPAIDRALVCLTDREYGPWALAAWPVFSDAVLAADA